MKKNNTNNNATINFAQVVKEESTMKNLINNIELCSEEETARIMAGIDNASFIEVTSQADLAAALFGCSETKCTTANITETAKEEAIMTNAANNLATRTLNMNRTERLVYVWDIILHVTKTTDELYIKKDELAKFLFDNDIISRMPSNNEIKRTKRQEFVDILDTAVQNLIKTKVITPVNAVPVGDFSMDNAPSNDISKESEVLPETVAETVSQFTRAQCTQVLGRILMDSTAQQVFGTVSDYIVHSHVAKVLFNKTMNVIKNGKFTKEKTVFSDTEIAVINEFIHKLCAYGYLTLNESGKSYSLSDAIKNKKGIWKHEPTGIEYVVDYKNGVFAARNGKTAYKLSEYKILKDNKKKLNRYVLQDTCVFQGFAKGGDK